MKESIEAALLGRAQPLAPARHHGGLLSRRRDMHIHVPEGATPKDGPTAGVAIDDGDRVGAHRHPGARATSR